MIYKEDFNSKFKEIENEINDLSKNSIKKVDYENKNKYYDSKLETIKDLISSQDIRVVNISNKLENITNIFNIKKAIAEYDSNNK